MFLLVLALLSSALAPATRASADAPCPSDQPCVVVHWTGVQEGTQVVTVDSIVAWADLANPPYQTRVLPHTDPQSEPRPGQALSIRHLLGQLDPPIAPASVTFTEAPNRDGVPSTLTTNDLGDPSDPAYPFADALMPALFVVGNNDAIGYIRPLRGDDDTNGDDFWQTNSHGALNLTVHTTGKLLNPTVRASRTKTTIEKTNSFTTSFDEPPATSITYAWNFGDGGNQRTQAATVQHAYKASGSYFVVVTVVGTDGSIGQSKPVKITVGKPAKPHGSTPTPGTGSSHHPSGPSTGPNHSSGERAGTTPSTAPKKPTAAPKPTRSSKPPAADPSPVATPQPTEVDALTSAVRGVVISNIDVVAPKPASRAVAQTAPAARQSAARRISLTFAWSLVVLLLLGLGAARESRWVARHLGRSRIVP